MKITEEYIKKLKRSAYTKQTLKRLPDDRPDLPIKVYLGSGSLATQVSGYINIDIQPYAGCILWDFTEGLPFIENSSVDKFLSRLSLEFLPRKKVLPLFKEVLNKLKPGGQFEILAFDLKAHCEHLLYGDFVNDHEYILRNLYGRQLLDKNGDPIPGTFKTTMFTYRILAMCLASTGFVKITRAASSRLRTRMLVTAYKPEHENEIRFLTTEGLTRDIVENKYKLRFH